MKHVDQETGRDLEQSEIQHHAGSRGERGGLRPPIELGAILNTKCTRCGSQGHLAIECFNTTGTRYDLIPEEPEMRGVVHGAYDELHYPKPVGRGRGATMPSWMTDPGFLNEKKKQDKKAAKHERKARKKMKKERKKVGAEQLLFNFSSYFPTQHLTHHDVPFLAEEKEQGQDS